MKAFPAYLLVLLLMAGCAAGIPVGFPFTPASVKPTTNYFAYRIDPVIAGRYGTTGEVAWKAGAPGQRPYIVLLGETPVTFKAGATPGDIARFAAAFDAVVSGPRRSPSSPDGAIPAKATDDYLVTFRTENVSLEALDDMGEISDPISGGWVFSSDTAAKIFLQNLRVRQLAEPYKVAFIGLNALLCIPEDCGPDAFPIPDYPFTEPRPTPPPPPAPELRPMSLESVTCLQTSIPQGKQGILRVTGILSDGCWRLHEVRAIVDDDRREVRLEATAARPAGAEACAQMISYPQTEVAFYPARTGTYRVISTVSPKDALDVPRESTCEVEVVAHE